MWMRNCRLAMATSGEILQRLEQRSAIADQMISRLKDQLQSLKQSAYSYEEQKLSTENGKLQAEVEHLKSQLSILEMRNGLIQISSPVKAASLSTSTTNQVPSTPQVVPQTGPQSQGEKRSQEAGQAPLNGKEKKQKGNKKGEGTGGKKGAPAAPLVIDASLLDLRVGRIIGVKKHPDADTLYVEEVDCGEECPRTVVSGLVNNIPIEEMQNKVVILCCNLKPAKMRGILSQAMVMCACSPEKIEILDPPPGSEPGDRVSFDGYPSGEGFPIQMNPKKKIFEKIQPDLKTDGDKVATYKGVPFKIEGKGVVTAPTMSLSQIK